MTCSCLKPAEIGAGGSRASFPTEWTDMKKSDIKFLAGITAAGLAAIASIWFLVWIMMGQIQYENDQQHKQDACLKAGGMWIDNRHTTSYCFFNK